MRILATVERYAPAIGGAERVVQRVAEGLAERGHEVHVLTGGERESVELAGVQVHRVPVSGNEARGIEGERSSVLDTVREVSPQLLFNYAAQTWATDCCLELLERPREMAMVLAPCGFSGLRARRYESYFEAMPARLRSYDALILHSSVYQDWDFAVAAGADRRFVIANGADPPAQSDTLGLAREERSLAMTVGSHVLSKGHTEFARAVRSLARERSLGGVIVAPGRRGVDALRGCQLSCSLRARGRTLDVIDGSPAGTVPAALRAADLFLFTSRVECAPLVILEAMAAATPWVSYDVGNVSELAGGVVVADHAELLAAAGEILDGGGADLGARGREAWGAGHRWPDVVARYESVFEEVLAARAGA